MEVTIATMLDMAADLLDIVPDGWDRSVFRDTTKLGEETGEVCEAVIKTSKTKDDVAEELADVLNVCCTIAIRLDIDLKQAVIDKHKKRIKKRLDFYGDGELPEGWNPRVKF